MPVNDSSDEFRLDSSDEFRLDDTTTQALTGSFSEDRLSTYLRATGDPARALRLHGWNTAISAAFYGPLQCLEVVFRNAVDRALTRTYGACTTHSRTPG